MANPDHGHALVESEPQNTTVKKKLGIGFWLSAAWLALIVLLAVLAPILPIKDPTETFRASQGGAGAKAGPSADHWFGTDENARDVFARTIHGARVSLTVGFAAVAIGMTIGGSLGMISGFFRGWFDRIFSFIFLVLLSFPALVLAILMTALLDRSLLVITIILGVLAIAPIGRLARAATIQFADREFVMAARAIGAKPWRILVRELLPNVLIPMAALGLLGMAVSIVAEGALAFLGLSVEGGAISWGKLINEGRGTRLLEDQPLIAFAPIVVLFLTVLALNYAGDKVREYFDVRELSI
ncbi:MAG: ABC transporter permease [Acidimicrobiales bacterium]|nr:ABC transporter permease [Acidimicrobiales bacterium]